MKKEKIITEVFGGEAVLSPSDLLSKEFKRAVGGYNTNEVDEFLERVADALEQLIQQVRTLKEEAEQQRERIDEFRQMEASLRNALISSQKFGEDIIESAKREAQLLLEEARMKKSQAQLEASKLPLALSQDILILEQQRSRLRVEMMAILATHHNLLDSLIPLDTVKPPASVFEVAPGPGAGISEGFSSLQEDSIVWPTSNEAASSPSISAEPAEDAPVGDSSNGSEPPAAEGEGSQ